jgi:hypothetical protein
MSYYFYFMPPKVFDKKQGEIIEKLAKTMFFYFSCGLIDRVDEIEYSNFCSIMKDGVEDSYGILMCVSQDFNSNKIAANIYAMMTITYNVKPFMIGDPVGFYIGALCKNPNLELELKYAELLMTFFLHSLKTMIINYNMPNELVYLVPLYTPPHKYGSYYERYGMTFDDFLGIYSKTFANGNGIKKRKSGIRKRKNNRKKSRRNSKI